MKLILIAYLCFLSMVSGDGCKKRASGTTTCFKGRLEIKGQCMNYTIKVLEGEIDTASLVSSWKNEATGLEHKNVFRLASVCNFPADIREGEEFYFTIDPAPRAGNCAVCMAYYPTPPKALSIVVQKQACQ